MRKLDDLESSKPAVMPAGPPPTMATSKEIGLSLAMAMLIL
jgi:hypothetical protein